MPKQHHYLKIESEFFRAVECKEKEFEIRLNDRRFQPLDVVVFDEVINGSRTGNSLPPITIKYVLDGHQAERYGLKSNHCVFGW